MKESIFRKVVEEISHESPDIKGISFHWFGKPLLNPNFFNLAEIARTYLPSTSLGMSSNANLLSSQKISQLLNSKLNWVGIWPDTIDPELYDRIRTGGELNKVEQTVIELLEKREELGRQDFGIGVGAILYKNKLATFKDFLQRWEAAFSRYKNVGVYASESHDWAGKFPLTMF